MLSKKQQKEHVKNVEQRVAAYLEEKKKAAAEAAAALEADDSDAENATEPEQAST